MGCLIRYQSHLGPERGALAGINTWHPECKVMHLNVGGGQLGYLSQYQVFLHIYTSIIASLPHPTEPFNGPRDPQEVIQIAEDAIYVDLMTRCRKTSFNTRARKHRERFVREAPQIPAQRKEFNKSDTLLKLQSDPHYAATLYEHQWQLSHITNDQKVQLILPPKAPKRSKKPLGQTRSRNKPKKKATNKIGKKRSAANTTIPENTQTQYLCHWEDSYIDPAHLFCFDNDTTGKICQTGPPRKSDGYVRVSWVPTGEADTTLKADAAFNVIKEAYDKDRVTRHSVPIAPGPLPDAHLSNLARQGISQNSRWVSHQLNHDLHQFITVELEETNLDLDIEATGEFALQYQNARREASPPSTEGSPSPSEATIRVVCCYTPDGKCVGHMAPDRLQWLYKRYEGSIDPVLTEPPSRSFPEEIARLLARYKDGQSHSGCKINAASQASIGEDAMTVLRTSFLIQKQRFSSPLTVAASACHFQADAAKS